LTGVTAQEELENRLEQLETECARLREENTQLKARLSLPSDALANEWDRVLCGKPRVKCAQCQNRQFLPVTGDVIHDHLSGKHTIGVYPMLEDEICSEDLRESIPID
jgi:hypothetical protein